MNFRNSKQIINIKLSSRSTKASTDLCHSGCWTVTPRSDLRIRVDSLYLWPGPFCLLVISHTPHGGLCSPASCCVSIFYTCEKNLMLKLTYQEKLSIKSISGPILILSEKLIIFSKITSECHLECWFCFAQLFLCLLSVWEKKETVSRVQLENLPLQILGTGRETRQEESSVPKIGAVRSSAVMPGGHAEIQNMILISTWIMLRISNQKYQWLLDFLRSVFKQFTLIIPHSSHNLRTHYSKFSSEIITRMWNKNLFFCQKNNWIIEAFSTSFQATNRPLGPQTRSLTNQCHLWIMSQFLPWYFTPKSLESSENLLWHGEISLVELQTRQMALSPTSRVRAAVCVGRL